MKHHKLRDLVARKVRIGEEVFPKRYAPKDPPQTPDASDTLDRCHGKGGYTEFSRLGDAQKTLCAGQRMGWILESVYESIGKLAGTGTKAQEVVQGLETMAQAGRKFTEISKYFDQTIAFKIQRQLAELGEMVSYLHTGQAGVRQAYEQLAALVEKCGFQGVLETIREDEQRRAKAEQERWAGRGPSGFRSYY